MKTALTKSISIPIMLIVNISIALLTAIAFKDVPHGEYTRPMGWTMLVGVTACSSFLVGAILAIIDEKRGFLGLAILGFILSLTPAPLAVIVFMMYARARGLQLAD